MRRITLTTVVALLAALVSIGVVATAPPGTAHVERPSYWPDPKADCTVRPCAGGKVPKARSLASALDRTAVGDTRVVCRADSMKRLRASIASARKRGYFIRPTDHRRFSAQEARRLLRVNQQLWKRCDYRQIQPAVTASGNNDRVVVMPGLYREQRSRNQPTHDNRCARWRIASDSGDPGALSHDFQIHCPNDANLVAVIGRGPDRGKAPSPPLDERHGIPAVGTCIRCNLQLEGSGVSADDVVVEAGDASKGDRGPTAAGHKKDVGIFVDRADGFVLRNLKVRHAREHDIYVLETDGYLLDRFKVYWGGGYGVLTFTGDHGLVQNCEAMGSGDSGLYPGSGADSTTQRYKAFYPKWRFSQTFRLCDSHHNTGGFSGTNSHGTLIARNNFYDNALGYTTDVFTAPGHPGFPQHGNVVRDNNFFDNNFNPYKPGSDVDPFIPAPVGTGLWLAGGNQNVVKDNHFYDNWRRGVMLFAVPDATVCGPPPVGSSTPVPGCDPAATSTSFGNKFHGNVMGVTRGGKVRPNGVDFWWDSFPGNRGNCWWDNTSAPGTDVTTSPIGLPSCMGGRMPGLSIGVGDAANELELVGCLVGLQVNPDDGSDYTCTWAITPDRPARRTTATAAASASTARTSLGSYCAVGLSPRLCAVYGGVVAPVTQQLSWLQDRQLPAVPLSADDAVTPLSAFTCSWWRRADQPERVSLVQRIRAMATAKVQGNRPYGYGAGLSDTRAIKLFESRCSTFEAGPFALYKLYGAAAPFASFS